MEVNNSSSSAVPKVIGVIVAVLVGCACVVIGAAVGILFFETRNVSALDLTPLLPPVSEDIQTPPPSIELARPPLESIPPDTLQALLNTTVPENDPYEHCLPTGSHLQCLEDCAGPGK